MITNKNRQKFFDVAIENFEIQTYKHKVLVILNHSRGHPMLTKSKANYHEFMVDKEHEDFSLGKLRNLALRACVPMGGLWTTFDDDDWRRSDYLETFFKRLKHHDLDLLFMKNRLEYNMNNGFIFRSAFMNGRAFFLAKRILEFEYDDLDTLEDTHIGEDYKKFNKKVGKFNNDPKLYIRVIHNNNTSVFVNAGKESISSYSITNNYQEFDASPDEKRYVNDVMQKEYLTFF